MTTWPPVGTDALTGPLPRVMLSRCRFQCHWHQLFSSASWQRRPVTVLQRRHRRRQGFQRPGGGGVRLHSPANDKPPRQMVRIAVLAAFWWMSDEKDWSFQYQGVPNMLLIWQWGRILKLVWRRGGVVWTPPCTWCKHWNTDFSSCTTMRLVHEVLFF